MSGQKTVHLDLRIKLIKSVLKEGGREGGVSLAAKMGVMQVHSLDILGLPLVQIYIQNPFWTQLSRK